MEHLEEPRRRRRADESAPPRRKKSLPAVDADATAAAPEEGFAALVDSFAAAAETAAEPPRLIPLAEPDPVEAPVKVEALVDEVEEVEAVEVAEVLEGEIATEEPLAPRPRADDEAGRSLEEDDALWSQIDLAGEDEEEDLAPPSMRRQPSPTLEEALDEIEPIATPSFHRPPAPEEVFAEAEAMEADEENVHEIEPYAPASAAPDDQVHVTAMRGVFAGPNTLSVVSPNLKPDYDEMNNVLSSFADLGPGQRAFIRISIRSAPEFKSEARNWVKAIKAGVDPDPPKQHPLKALFGWGSYLMRFMWFEANKSSTLIKGAPPLRPGAQPERKFTASMLDDEKKQEIRDADKKAQDPTHFDVALYVGAVGAAEDKGDLERLVEEASGGYSVYATPHQEFNFIEANALEATKGFMPGDKRLVLSATELGELAKIPDGTTTPEGLKVARSNFKHIMPTNPVRLADPYNPPAGIVPLGVINPHSDDRMFVGIRNSELDQHLFFCGRTGSGKSELMKWQVFGVAKSGYPIVVIDPHGQLTDDLLNALVINCPERLEDIVYVDLGDEEWPVAYNPLDIHTPEQIEPTVASIEEMLKKELSLGRDSAPRAVNYAVQALNALCEANLYLKDPETKCTLLHVVTFFLDAEFRQAVVSLCSNQSVRETFDPDTGLFEQLADKARAEQVQPIVRAFQPLGNSASFSAVFSAGENRLQFTDLITHNKIILVKLARHQHQARLGEFIGSLILPYLLSSVGDWGRTRDPITRVEKGRGCRVFVDEAPTLLGPDSAAIAILAEARKYDLGLIFASQFLDQFDASVIKATLANTSSKLSLVLEPSSAKMIATSIAGSASSQVIKADDIAVLPNYHWYGNLLWPMDEAQKASSGPFSAACLPPIRSTLDEDHLRARAQVIDRSRRLICNRRAEIDAKRRHLVENIKAALSLLHTERMSFDNVPEDLQSGAAFGINMSGDPTRIWK